LVTAQKESMLLETVTTVGFADRRSRGSAETDNVVSG
jgi:hypothetical protein